jgi:hypothetical protein
MTTDQPFDETRYPLLYWSAIGLFIVAGLFVGGAVIAQLTIRESFGSFWLFLPGMIALVGAGNALLWRSVLSRRDPALTASQRIGRNIVHVALSAVGSVFAVTGLQFVGAVIFIYVGR